LRKVKSKPKTKRVYDPDAVKMKANHVTAEQWLMRHSHCVTVRQVYADIERTHTDHVSFGLGVPHKVEGTDFTPRSIKAVCNFPQDGFCGKDPISTEQLAEVNARLGGGMKLGSPLLAYVKGEIDLEGLSAALSKPNPEDGEESAIEEALATEPKQAESKLETQPKKKLTLKLSD